MSENDFNFDMDGDGIMDSYANPLDIDDDGMTDIILADIDGDGVMDGYVYDLLDSDNDGYLLGMAFTNMVDRRNKNITFGQ